MRAKTAKPAGEPGWQVPTYGVTIEWIMSTAAFRRGVADRRAGRPMTYRGNDELHWEYERGRLWASLAPVEMPLRIGGKLNPNAVALYEAAEDRKLIL
jgi:hypothetical protein